MLDAYAGRGPVFRGMARGLNGCYRCNLFATCKSYEHAEKYSHTNRLTPTYVSRIGNAREE